MIQDEIRTRVRYGETDQMGVVYHANYLLYYEMGRTEYMRARGYEYSRLERDGYFLAIVEAQLRYHANTGYDGELIIRTRVGKITRVQVTFHYQVLNAEGEILLSEGLTRLACVGKDLKVKRLPAEMIEALKSPSKTNSITYR
ncbi:unnamed protein product [marine sediment metagenome]|uniref:Uncharacterized protein n=1 Tax=marine sediment metagenome TaxID=412755 RepID=X0WNA9_9ZZZZ